MRDFLVYTSAGTNANVKLWVNKKERLFDIWVTNYSDKSGHLKEYADFYNERKGAKFPNFKWVCDSFHQQISQYKAIMITDDDLIMSTDTLNGLFRLFSERQAAVVTPAFSRFGKISHATTARELFSDYRYTNFAEVGCPIIRTDLLLDFMSVYDPDAVHCYGLDWWYLNHWGDKTKGKIIISDTYYCSNPRDFFKSGGTREIDRHNSDDDRRALWEMQKKKLGIQSFPKKITATVPKHWTQVLIAMPKFMAEKGFSLLMDRLYPKLAKPAKRLLRRSPLR